MSCRILAAIAHVEPSFIQVAKAWVERTSRDELVHGVLIAHGLAIGAQVTMFRDDAGETCPLLCNMGTEGFACAVWGPQFCSVGAHCT